MRRGPTMPDDDITQTTTREGKLYLETKDRAMTSYRVLDSELQDLRSSGNSKAQGSSIATLSLLYLLDVARQDGVVAPEVMAVMFFGVALGGWLVWTGWRRGRRIMQTIKRQMADKNGEVPQ